jgi:hypothetical protein
LKIFPAFAALSICACLVTQKRNAIPAMDVDPAAVILVTMIHGATGALTLAATLLMAALIRRAVYVPR